MATIDPSAKDRPARDANRRGLLNAAHPLTWPVLKDVLGRTYRRFDHDRIPEVAASVTFFALLAIFPAFASVVAVYGLFADRASIAHDLALVSRFLPRGAILTLTAELQRLIAQPPRSTGITLVAGSAIVLWSASGGLKALLYGLDVAYEVRETRHFVRLSAVALLLTAVAIVFCALAMNLAIVLPNLLHQLPFGGMFHGLYSILSWPVSYCFGVFLLAAIYAYGPNRPRRKRRLLTWGSLVASALWLLGTLIFKWYVQEFGSFDQVYGNLGAIVGFLTWIWLSLVIVLFGAELNCELERRDV